MASELEKIGMKRCFQGEFWNVFSTTCPDADRLLVALEEKGILGGLKVCCGCCENDCDTDCILCCSKELNTKEDIDEVIAIAKEVF